MIARIDVEKIRRAHGEGVHLLARPALLGLLAEVLPEGMVRFGSTVADPLALAESCDVVVGADGIRSVTRAAMFGDRYPLTVPRHAVTPEYRGLDVSVGGETWVGAASSG